MEENNEKVNVTKSMDYSKDFMLEEYKHLAEEFHTMHEVLTKMFNYALLINAAPITSLSFLVKSGEPILQILREPMFLIVVGFVCAANFFVALIIFNGRIQQYVYARAVNMVRRFFAEKDREILKYLYLPTGTVRPKFKSMGFLRWSAWGISILGGLWGAIFMWFILPLSLVLLHRILISFVFFFVYLAVIWVIKYFILIKQAKEYPAPVNDISIC